MLLFLPSPDSCRDEKEEEDGAELAIGVSRKSSRPTRPARRSPWGRESGLALVPEACSIKYVINKNRNSNEYSIYGTPITFQVAVLVRTSYRFLFRLEALNKNHN